MANVVTLKVAPDPVHYLAIDGTGTADSRLLGGHLQRLGWTSILSYLAPAQQQEEGTALRLVDPDHPYLSIHELTHRAGALDYGVPVVCPAGLDDRGVEPFQQNQGNAMKESARYTRKLILHPRVVARQQGGCALDDDKLTGRPLVAEADLLFVSSHGYVSGLMQDEQGQTRYLFSVGRSAASGKGFMGPLWIILSQCSTLNTSVLAPWMALLAKSKPGVRGILGYESKSPRVSGTVRVLDGFIRGTTDPKQPLTLLEAWRLNNRGTKWTAIVHEDARTDHLEDIPALRRRPLTKVTVADYRFYSAGCPEGTTIDISDPPFDLKLEGHMASAEEDEDGDDEENVRREQAEAGDGLREITVSTIGEDWAGIYDKEPIRATIRAPAGEAIVQAVLVLVNTRQDFAPQFRWDQIFQAAKVQGDGALFDALSVPRSRALRLQPTHPCKSLVVDATAKDNLESLSNFAHNYIWLDVEIRTDTGARYRHEFKAKGWRM